MANITAKITETDLEKYKAFLVSKGLSEKTVKKYLYDAGIFTNYLKNREITPEVLEDFKKNRLKKFTVAGTNGLICGVNSLLDYMGCPHRIVRIDETPRERDTEKTAVTKEEYLKILKAVKRSGNERLYLIVESICGAGLKLSEVQYLTVEAVIKGKVEPPSGRHSIYLPKNLRSDLLEYCKNNDIFVGTILVTRNGNVPDKANVSREIKAACSSTGIDPEKLSTKALREYYFRNFEDYRSEIVEMMDREWREPKAAI